MRPPAWLALLLLSPWCVTTVFAGGPNARARERSLALSRALGGYERTAGADDIRALGPDADQQLIDWAEAPATSRLQRQRAIAALRFVPSVRAHAYARAVLERAAAAVEGPDALDAVAALMALSPYVDALPAVLPQLAHPCADVRHAAAATLGALGSRDALGPLQARLSIERDPTVLSALRHALTRLGSGVR